VAAIRARVPSARVVAVSRELLPADWPVPPGVELAAPGQDVRPLLHSRTVGAAAAGSDADPLPGVLEPMAAGIPVVVTSRVRERLGGGPDPELRVADDPVHFARCVVDLLEGEAVRRQAGEAARHFAATHWSWDVHAARLGAMLDEVVKGPAAEPTRPAEPSPVAAELGG
jgi:glycosyltransferase involved in cell wall biosynthesis